MNTFFSNIADLLGGTKARASAVEANFSQVEAGFDGVAQRVLGYATESGSGNEYVLTLYPQPTTMPASGSFIFLATHGNTGPATLRIGALAPVSLLDAKGQTLTASIIASGEVVAVHFNGVACRLAGITKSYADSLSFSSSLPSQGGNAGKLISTNGTTAAWGNALSHLVVDAGSAAEPGLRVGDADTGLHLASAGALAVGVDGAVVATFTNAGIDIPGAAKRITGDFSNASASARAAICTNVVNGATLVPFVPSGSGASSGAVFFGASGVDNASFGSAIMSATGFSLSSSKTGAGTYLPMMFYAGGVESLRLLTSGAIAIGGAANYGALGDVMRSSGPMAPPTWVAQASLSAGTAGVAALAMNLTGNPNVSLSSVNGGQLAGLRNRVINGCGFVRQRAPVAASSSYAYGSSDRMMAAVAGATGGTVSASALASSFGLGFGLCSASWIAGAPAVQHRIEQSGIADMAGKVVTLSGKVYQDFNSTRTIGFQIVKAGALDNFSGAGVVLATGNVSAPTGALTSFSLTYTMSASDASTGIALFVYDTAASSAASKFFLVTELQFEIGSVATPFELRPIALELALCQRYYQEATIGPMYLPGAGYSALYLPQRLSNPMRVTPTTVAPAAGDSLVYRSSGGNYPPDTAIATAVGVADFYVRMEAAVNFSGWPIFGPIKFSAEL